MIQTAKGYREKVSSLNELKKQGLCIIEDDAIVVENHILEILEQKGLLISDLARLTGISRQNINAVVRNKMKPGVDFVLKVSYVLGEPIEKLFVLTDEAWVKPYKHERDATLYLDMIHMEKVDTKEKRRAIKETGFEFYHIETREQISRKEWESRLKEFVERHFEEKEQQVKKEDESLTANQIKSTVAEELREEFNSLYSKIYKKLGQRIEPYVVS